MPISNNVNKINFNNKGLGVCDFPKFSVAMSVYCNDDPYNFDNAISSIINQTVPPEEIIIVVDGPVSFVTESIIQKYISMYEDKIVIVRFPENKGHAAARQAGVNAAKNKWVAIMDSDDIAVAWRFEKELRHLVAHPDISVIGANIAEFIGDVNNIVAYRVVPEEDEDIYQYIKSRCPFNQMTVMMNKADVLSVGGYQDWYCEEDYYLWIRLALAGYKFYNIQENLVYVRVGKEMYKRRGGVKYFKSERLLQKFMLKNKLISLPRYVYNVLIRFIVQVAMPNSVRGWVFRKFARS